MLSIRIIRKYGLRHTELFMVFYINIYVLHELGYIYITVLLSTRGAVVSICSHGNECLFISIELLKEFCYVYYKLFHL